MIELIRRLVLSSTTIVQQPSTEVETSSAVACSNSTTALYRSRNVKVPTTAQLKTPKREGEFELSFSFLPGFVVVVVVVVISRGELSVGASITWGRGVRYTEFFVDHFSFLVVYFFSLLQRILSRPCMQLLHGEDRACRA